MAKVYSSKAGAKAAIKKQGLQFVPHDIKEEFGKFMPYFHPTLSVDVHEIRGRGFAAGFKNVGAA